MRSGVSCATVSMSMPPSVDTTKDDARGRAVDEGRQVELAVDVGAVLDIEAADGAAGRAGLQGHERGAEHLARANRSTSSIDFASRTPPLSPAEASLNLPLPRPPAWIWLFTTHTGPPSSSAALRASEPT